MTHAELSAGIVAHLNESANTLHLTKAAAGRLVDFIGQTLMAELLLDGKTSFPGFGNFSVIIRKERVCNNPQDAKKKITVPAHKAVKFRALSAINAQING